MQSIKEKFRLDNVLTDREINELEKEKEDTIYKYKITRKDFERKYCGGYEEWHMRGLYDRWGKYDQNSYMMLYKEVSALEHKASILKYTYENECKKRVVNTVCTR